MYVSICMYVSVYVCLLKCALYTDLLTIITYTCNCAITRKPISANNHWFLCQTSLLDNVFTCMHGYAI